MAVLGAPLLAAFVAFVGAVARQTGVPRYRTVWAEDGAQFGQCPLLDPNPLTCLVRPYDGWVHIVPRTLGWLAASLPLEWFSYTATALAALVLAGCAFLVARAVAGASGSLVAGAIAGMSLALVLPAGLEVTGNITNLPWILYVASLAVLCCAIVGRPLDRLDVALLVATLASTPFGFLLVGLLGIIAWLRRTDRGPRLLLATAGVIALIQAGMGYVAPRNAIPETQVTLTWPVGWLNDLLFVRGPFGTGGIVPGPTVGVLAIAMVIAVAWQGFRSRTRVLGNERSAPWWAGAVALITFGLACAAVFAASSYLNRHTVPRYEYIPAAGAVIALMLGAALVLREVRWSLVLGRHSISAQTVGVGVLAIVVGLGFATTFRVMTGASTGPSFPAAFRSATTACAGTAGVVEVPISPRPARNVRTRWVMLIPCARVGR
jgi:hypothetical protein